VLIKLLLCTIWLISNLWNNPTTTNIDNIQQIFQYCDNIIIRNDSKVTSVPKDNEEFQNIIDNFLSLINCSHEMPAFSVSLDNETREATQDGLWVEFQLSHTVKHNDMPFDAILIEVNADFGGFNLIRKHNNKYEGRCFYIDLIDNNMEQFENFLLETITELNQSNY